jgi:hypothetical protein
MDQIQTKKFNDLNNRIDLLIAKLPNMDFSKIQYLNFDVPKVGLENNQRRSRVAGIRCKIHDHLLPPLLTRTINALEQTKCRFCKKDLKHSLSPTKKMIKAIAPKPPRKNARTIKEKESIEITESRKAEGRLKGAIATSRRLKDDALFRQHFIDKVTNKAWRGNHQVLLDRINSGDEDANTLVTTVGLYLFKISDDDFIKIGWSSSNKYQKVKGIQVIRELKCIGSSSIVLDKKLNAIIKEFSVPMPKDVLPKGLIKSNSTREIVFKDTPYLLDLLTDTFDEFVLDAVTDKPEEVIDVVINYDLQY